MILWLSFSFNLSTTNHYDCRKPRSHDLGFLQFAVVPDFVVPQSKADTLLHEAIHAITSYAVNIVNHTKEAPHGVTVGPELTAAVHELEFLFRRAQQSLPADEYGASNVYEFLAELANPDFRRKLQKIPAQNGNMLSRIVAAIKRILGSLLGVRSLKDDSLRNLQKFIDHVEPIPFLSQRQATRVASRGFINENFGRFAPPLRGITNAEQDASLTERGMNAPPKRRRGDAKVMQGAESLLSNAEFMNKLAHVIARQPRAIAAEENVAMAQRWLRLKDEYDDLVQSISEAQNAGDADAVKEMEKRLVVVEKQMAETVKAREGGVGEAARTLRTNRFLFAAD